MIENRVVPSIEVEPKVYALSYKLDKICYQNGNVTDFSWKNTVMLVAYTYEEAVRELSVLLQNVAKEEKVVIKLGDLTIINYTSRSIGDLFNDAYGKYGNPELESVEETTEPELLTEEG